MIFIVFGECFYICWDVKCFFEDVSVDILQFDIVYVGGILEMKWIVIMVEVYDVVIVFYCLFGLVVFVVSVQVVFLVLNFIIFEMSLGMYYNVEVGDIDFFIYLKNLEVFDIKDGYVDVLMGYGLGIDIDEEMVKKIVKEMELWQCKIFYGLDGSI